MFITGILFLSFLFSLLTIGLSVSQTFLNIEWFKSSVCLILKLPGLIIPNIVTLFMLYLNVFVFPLKTAAIIAIIIYIIGILLWVFITVLINATFRFKNIFLDIVCLGTPFFSFLALWIIGIINDR